MSTINFYPGPSKVHPRVEMWMQEAFVSGILGMNHRSEPFMQMLSQTVDSFRIALEVPTDYQIYFISSATEAWEIVAQSLIAQRSLHLYNGAFGEKWKEYTQRIHSDSLGINYGINEIPILPSNHTDYEVLCLTHCETSNGTELSASALHSLRDQFEGLIAIDATSSMAGVSLPWEDADVWFASVQKCFGMPSGLGVMVVSPQALRTALLLNDHRYYNSLLFLDANFKKLQTPYTPNTLGIFLLGKMLLERASITTIDENSTNSAREYYTFLENLGIKLLVNNPEVRSRTVIPFLTVSDQQTQDIKSYLLQRAILIGNGYGAWKTTSLRIANFPAIEETERAKLKRELTNYFTSTTIL